MFYLRSFWGHYSQGSKQRVDAIWSNQVLCSPYLIVVALLRLWLLYDCDLCAHAFGDAIKTSNNSELHAFQSGTTSE